MITRVDVDNFKGLRNFSMPMGGALTVVAGANGSGKTSCSEALTFALQLAQERPADVVRSWWGDDENLLLNLWSRRKRVRFAVEGDFVVGSAGSPVHLTWTIEIAKRRGWGVSSESVKRLASTGERGQAEEVLKRSWRTISVRTARGGWEKEVKELPSFISTVAPERRRRFPELWALKEGLRGIMVPFFDPTLLRVRSRESELGFTGENFAGFVHQLQHEQPGRFAEVIRHLKAAFPDVDCVETARTKFGWAEVQVRRSVRGLGPPQVFRSWQINDGVLRLLAILVLPYASPGLQLIAIEEPENGMHPKLLGATLSLLREMPVQVLVTTHSPVLLNFARPDEVVLLRNRGVDGPEAVRFVDLPEAMQRYEMGHMDVGDIMYNLDDERLFRRRGAVRRHRPT